MNKTIVNKLKEANESEGYFITITSLKDGSLHHYQAQKTFPKEDLLPTITELNNLVMADYKLPQGEQVTIS